MDIFQAMRVFVRVVETGSFTAAAQALGYSTAQTSRLLSELESSLQARLLQRSTRRLALTEVGARYLERCRLILGEIEDANAEAAGAHLIPRGHLRVQSTTGLGIQLLAPLVARYTELYPQVHVDLTLSQRQPDLLEEGHDLVITLSAHLPDSELIGQPLGSIFSVISAAPSYLEGRNIPKVPEDLHQHRCLHLVDPLFTDSWTFRDDEGEQVIRPGNVFQVNVAEAMAKAAEAGLGICLLPDYVAVGSYQRGSLVRLLPHYRLHEKNIYALYPSRRFLDAKVKTWVEFLKEEIPKVLERHQAIVDDPAHWA
ncbi:MULTISPECIES: LysR family transcriptional regulator [Pseudomonas]|uniref:LysR family transcriptional regulator n=2 Tax=Pseudomonas TaxID=286 RepID=A0ABT4WMG9_PSEFR|nr:MULTISPECIES: LysR family transcriptional regulator [Pseudomonas]MBP3859039.1 LysR family transcriptional regulator [Pseudomonas sp.]MBP3933524.1 LysR family transcriptional regulator [Pseudomonas sp.]MDA7021174.1 LysR family transcriptional regulator [Pseudomonas fragi]MQT85396.1 LysR family transcriptional regulator [Pseudomonas sp. FSL R10-2964]MQU53271.1 LysR family transcriptional regulator [Pseudomonas sp. FSL R10-1339]